MGKEMDLKIHILARGEEAISCIKRVRDDIAGLSSTIGKVGSVFFAPLRIAAGGVMMLGTAVTALAAKSLAAAAADEKLQQRLIAVFGTAEKGKKVFADIQALSRRSWLSTEELVEARVIMKEFGLDSERNLGAMSNAARAAGQSVGDMARAVSVLQLKNLKSLGIEVKTDDGRYTATYRDALGNIQKLTAKTADEMRKKLMDVFAMRFGVSMKPKGLSEFWNMFKHNVDDAFSDIGGPLLDAATRFVSFLSEKLRGLIESGQLENIGKKIAEWLDGAVINVMAFINSLPEIWAGLKKSMENGATGFQQIINAAVSGIGTVITVALVEGFSATLGLWKGIAEMISGAVGQQIAMMPGMGRYRRQRAIGQLEGMSGEEAASFQKDTGIAIPDIVRQQAGMNEAKGFNFGMDPDMVLFDWLKKLTPEMEAKLGAYGGGKEMIQGLKTMTGSLSTAKDRVAGAAQSAMEGVDSVWKKETGTRSPSEIVAANKAEVQAKKDTTEMLLVEVRRRKLLGIDNTGRAKYGDEEYRQGLVDSESKLKPGQRAGGGVVKNITQVFIRNTDVLRKQNEVKSKGWQLAASPAGG
jgi:hypothetical protein